MYKIIKNNKVIDVVRQADFIRFLPSGVIIRTGRDFAEGVTGSDNQTPYSFGINNQASVTEVSLEAITLEEFNRLQSLLNSEVAVSANERILADAKAEVISKLSDTCKTKITEGFSIRLLDGKYYNFKLTTEDQLNLLNLENQLNSSAATFVYHATGLPCRVFLREDIVKIIKAYRKHVLYHTTYFNVAKQYINSLIDLDKVQSFKY